MPYVTTEDQGRRGGDEVGVATGRETVATGREEGSEVDVGTGVAVARGVGAVGREVEALLLYGREVVVGCEG